MLKHRSIIRAVIAIVAASIACVYFLASTAFNSVFERINFAPEAAAQIERAAIESATVEPGFTVAASAPVVSNNSAREHSNLVKSLDRTPGIVCPKRGEKCTHVIIDSV